MSPASTGLTRWGVPLAVIWAGVLLSAWVTTQHLAAWKRVGFSPKLVLLLVGTPALSVAVLVVLRRLAGRRAPSRNGDLLVLWLITFRFVVHASFLAVGVGMLEGLGRAIPAATAGLMLGLGPLIAGLEPGSPMGLLTPATEASDEAWGRAHRFAGVAFSLAGGVGLLGQLLGPRPALLATAIAAVAALLAAVTRARRAPRAPEADEEASLRERPTEETGSP